jgi:hypothetical protein
MTLRYIRSSVLFSVIIAAAVATLLAADVSAADVDSVSNVSVSNSTVNNSTGHVNVESSSTSTSTVVSQSEVVTAATAIAVSSASSSPSGNLSNPSAGADLDAFGNGVAELAITKEELSNNSENVASKNTSNVEKKAKVTGADSKIDEVMGAEASSAALTGSALRNIASSTRKVQVEVAGAGRSYVVPATLTDTGVATASEQRNKAPQQPAVPGSGLGEITEALSETILPVMQFAGGVWQEGARVPLSIPLLATGVMSIVCLAVSMGIYVWMLRRSGFSHGARSEALIFANSSWITSVMSFEERVNTAHRRSSFFGGIGQLKLQVCH